MEQAWRVLCVDDEAGDRRMMRESFADAAIPGELQLAEDGQQALALAEREQYDAVVLDLMMPQLDGIEVARRLRDAGFAGPIAMVTGADDDQNPSRSYGAGVDAHFVKATDGEGFAWIWQEVLDLMARATPPRP